MFGGVIQDAKLTLACCYVWTVTGIMICEICGFLRISLHCHNDVVYSMRFEFSFVFEFEFELKYRHKRHITPYVVIYQIQKVFIFV